MSEYIWRLHMIVPASEADAGGQVAAKTLPGGPAERRMFSVPLTDALEAASHAEGVSEVAYMGASALLTEPQHRALLAGLEEAGVPAQWVALRADTEEAVEASDGLANEGAMVVGRHPRRHAHPEDGGMT
jgi:hypothetical protein